MGRWGEWWLMVIKQVLDRLHNNHSILTQLAYVSTLLGAICRRPATGLLVAPTLAQRLGLARQEVEWKHVLSYKMCRRKSCIFFRECMCINCCANSYDLRSS